MDDATTLETSSPPSTAEERERLFAALVERYAGAVRRLASSYEAEPGLAEDLAQEILLAVWEALPAFRGDARVQTYLFRIAHNRAARHVARQRSRSKADPLDEEGPRTPRSGDPSPEERTLDAEDRDRLRAAVRSLRESLRQVVVLRLEGLSTPEIGDVLGLTSNNVVVRLHRARAELRRLLGDDTGETTR